MTTPKHKVRSKEDVQADINYLKDKLSFTFDLDDRNKLIKQTELLENVLVVYRINQGE